jgi:hypothetical protein
MFHLEVQITISSHDGQTAERIVSQTINMHVGK